MDTRRNSIVWDWKPSISVGPVEFGMSAAPLIEAYNLQKLEPDCASANWDTYEFLEYETRIYVENSILNSVGCFDNLYYKGKNLLGLSLADIHEILGLEDEIGEVIADQTPIEYLQLGLQLWLKNHVIVSGFCYGSVSDD